MLTITRTSAEHSACSCAKSNILLLLFPGSYLSRLLFLKSRHARQKPWSNGHKSDEVYKRKMMRRLTSCENENRGLKCVSDVGLRRYWYTKISLFSKTRVATRLSLYFASLSLTRDAITLRYRSTTYSTTSVVLPYSSTGRRRYAIVRRALMYYWY